MRVCVCVCHGVCVCECAHLGIFSALVRKQSDSIRVLAVAHLLHIRRGSALCVRTDLDPGGQFVRRTALHMMGAPPRCATGVLLLCR